MIAEILIFSGHFVKKRNQYTVLSTAWRFKIQYASVFPIALGENRVLAPSKKGTKQFMSRLYSLLLHDNA